MSRHILDGPRTIRVTLLVRVLGRSVREVKGVFLIRLGRNVVAGKRRMARLLRIALAEFIRQTVHERDVDRDSLVVPSVGAGHVGLVVHMAKSILEYVGLCVHPILVEGEECGLHYVEAFAVFVFALYEPGH